MGRVAGKRGAVNESVGPAKLLTDRRDLSDQFLAELAEQIAGFEGLILDQFRSIPGFRARRVELQKLRGRHNRSNAIIEIVNQFPNDCEFLFVHDTRI